MGRHELRDAHWRKTGRRGQDHWDNDGGRHRRRVAANEVFDASDWSVWVRLLLTARCQNDQRSCEDQATPDNRPTLLVCGMIGPRSYSRRFIGLVYLPATIRVLGIGSRPRAMVEQAGANRGCKSAFLVGVTRQAPGCFERRYWTGFGHIACEPP